MRIFATASDGTKYIESKFLLNAYCNGMFPMADGKDGEIHWFSPEQRGIIPLDGLKVSRSLRQTMTKRIFHVRINTAFESTMRHCAEREEVWISETIVQSYLRLHQLGFAHSVETWHNDTLVGGLYGVSIGGAFFGESMFSRKTDASKVALVHLVKRLNDRGYNLLDTQYSNPHLATLGCIEIPKQEYLNRLQTALTLQCTFE
ncbi:MAG: leucyl/phenylalanyl-tRNA--protein transferase [Bacteroidota bacterium]|nr:leucyl/phenylalanyl-tRNA--protein transferase [Bacteroidota bacterium]